MEVSRLQQASHLLFRMPGESVESEYSVDLAYRITGSLVGTSISDLFDTGIVYSGYPIILV